MREREREITEEENMTVMCLKNKSYNAKGPLKKEHSWK